MTDWVTVAAQYYGVDTGQIVGARDYGEYVNILVDMGIKGTPKYTVSKSDLLEFSTQEQAAEAYLYPDAITEDVPELDATRGAVDLAKREGVDLSELNTGDRITVYDVKRYLEERE